MMASLRWGRVASPAFTKAECNAPPWVSCHIYQLRQELFTLCCTTIGQQQRHQLVNFRSAQHQSVTTVTQGGHFCINVKWSQLAWPNQQLSYDRACQYPVLPFSSHHRYLYHCQACYTNPMGKLSSTFSFTVLTITDMTSSIMDVRIRNISRTTTVECKSGYGLETATEVNIFFNKPVC